MAVTARSSFGPVAQIVLTTVYIWLWVLVLYLLHRAGVSENMRVIIVVAAVCAGLWTAVYKLGILSWPVATALAWLAAALFVIFRYG